MKQTDRQTGAVEQEEPRTIYLVKELKKNHEGVYYESPIAAFPSEERAMEDLEANPGPGRVQPVTLYGDLDD